MSIMGKSLGKPEKYIAKNWVKRKRYKKHQCNNCNVIIVL